MGNQMRTPPATASVETEVRPSAVKSVDVVTPPSDVGISAWPTIFVAALHRWNGQASVHDQL